MEDSFSKEEILADLHKVVEKLDKIEAILVAAHVAQAAELLRASMDDADTVHGIDGCQQASSCSGLPYATDSTSSTASVPFPVKR